MTWITKEQWKKLNTDQNETILGPFSILNEAYSWYALMRATGLFPQRPPTKLIREGDTGPYCPYCGSSLKTRLGFFKTSKCIQVRCENYYEC